MILQEQDINSLFQLAKQGIEVGLGLQEANAQLSQLQFEKPFSESAATFVTLHQHDRLRGCIGTLEAYRSLYEDVSANAYAAAFRDPRFQAMTAKELEFSEVMDMEISILTKPEPIAGIETHEELLQKLTPFEDGLIISDGYRRATFLPSVWEQLPDKQTFVNQLMKKAGISQWHESISCERYFVEAHSKSWDAIS